MTKKQKKMLCRIIVTAVLVLAIRLFSIGGLPGTLLYLAAYLIIGYDILRKAGKGILRGQVFDENFLMAVATVGAIGLAFYEKSGDFMEAVAVMLFYQIGELFQSYAVGKSRRNITALMDIRPDYANIEQDGQLTQVDPDDVPVGAVIVVQPGEKVPLDGVVARVDGVNVAVGNDKLMDKLGIAWHDCHSVGTIIHLALDGQYAGHIVISDVEKPHAKDAIAALKRIGVEKTVMLTGDRAKVADHVAQDLGVDEVHSELLPADKVSQVERLLSRAGGKLAFVGDGINDAPVLSRADIGIAMGAMGSDAAIEAADVVLMDDDPLKIAKAIRISRKCIRIVYENIAFALIVKALCLLLVAVGAANMWAAIFGDVGVMVIAVLNAIRALRVSKL